jgi:hypothetical protein
MDCSWARRRGSAGEISAREGAELSGRKQIADCRIVDLRSQRPGSIECAGFSEAGSIDGGPQEKLSDSSTCSDRLELVDTPHSRRRSMLDCNSARPSSPYASIQRYVSGRRRQTFGASTSNGPAGQQNVRDPLAQLCGTESPESRKPHE